MSNEKLIFDTYFRTLYLDFIPAHLPTVKRTEYLKECRLRAREEAVFMANLLRGPIFLDQTTRSLSAKDIEWPPVEFEPEEGEDGYEG